jgi:hypothetical protein
MMKWLVQLVVLLCLIPALTYSAKVLVDTDSVQTISGKTLTAPTIADPVFSGTASGSLSGMPLSAPTLSGTSTVTGLLDVSNGQIKFPATQNASSNATTLDDYEEGSWTPAIGGSATYTTQLGRYTKVGRLVTVICNLTINNRGSGSTTTISGLPFAAAAATFPTSYAHASWTSLAIAPVTLLATLAAGNSTITFTGATAANASLSINQAIFGNNAAVSFTLTYMTD